MTRTSPAPDETPRRGPAGGGLGGAMFSCALLSGACSGGGEGSDPPRERRPAERASQAPEAPGEAGREQHEAAPSSRAPAEIGVVEGAARLGASPATRGAPVELGQVLALDGPGRAVLELAAGARATLWTEGGLLLAESPDHGVWVVRGGVHVADPPGGLGSRSPLRLATPTATVELQGAGDVMVTVEPSGATTVAVLSGHVEVSSGEVDSRHRLRLVEVVAGLSVRVAERVEDPVQGPARLDDAVASARAALSVPPATTTVVPGLSGAIARLDEAMRWLEVEQRRGRDLTARHRAAVQAGRSDEAMQYQREIVAHAQTVHALRQTVLVRWERLALAAQTSPEGRAGAAEVAPRLDRLRSLLGS